ncbi:Protein of unknown function [Pyronema omphalodes CBS 100304]|uniref:Uncharacterized protein n=1 Tax=Pyronema omphalodes (strain CBS 100304) TaxID=1076935 RepID=U4LGJ8_PYROM|nr:Protein of unknown function [Pyronema omphalodes CBS 100304]
MTYDRRYNSFIKILVAVTELSLSSRIFAQDPLELLNRSPTLRGILTLEWSLVA